MTFDEAVSWLQTMLEVPLNQADANFTRIVPMMFLYAERRIYGDLAFLVTTITQQHRLTALNRETILPDNVRVLEQISVCTPAGPVTNASKRVTLERITSTALDMFWPQVSFKPGVPQKYALIGGTPQATLLADPFALDPPPPLPVIPTQQMYHVVRMMPTPDKSYTVELTGAILPDTLSPVNNETYLSTKYPELLLCACMVFGSGYQRDFGAQADDPQKAMSWETQYKYLMQGVTIEQSRLRGEGPGYTAQPPVVLAQTPRAP
jgi:hypothetical protein